MLDRNALLLHPFLRLCLCVGQHLFVPSFALTACLRCCFTLLR